MGVTDLGSLDPGPPLHFRPTVWGLDNVSHLIRTFGLSIRVPFPGGVTVTCVSRDTCVYVVSVQDKQLQSGQSQDLKRSTIEWCFRFEAKFVNDCFTTGDLNNTNNT